MSDTPRTDALWDAWASEKLPSGQFRYGPADLADLARRLERELTAERAMADRLAGDLSDLWRHYTLTGAAYEVIERALDARKEARGE